MPRPPVAILGAGAMGRVLGLRLAEAGYPIAAVLSRTPGPANALARLLGAPVSGDDLGQIPDVPLVVLAVPDDQIADLAETLLDAPRPWTGAVVLHTSGAVPASALGPLREAGARTLAFHPLQTVTRGSDASALDGVTVGIEGEPAGVAAGVELAGPLGLRYLVIRPEAKARVHLAAAMASNLLVTLLGMVQEVLASVDIDRAEAMQVLGPLIQGTLENVAASSPEEALTGPVARGDLGTLRQHGLDLRKHLPAFVPAYAALSVETVRLAVRSGVLDPDRAEAVLRLMEQMVTIPLPDASGGIPGSGGHATPDHEPQRPREPAGAAM
ncbi:MAG: DUF2520 domain-containing protein [Bacteroidota bacterium]